MKTAALPRLHFRMLIRGKAVIVATALITNKNLERVCWVTVVRSNRDCRMSQSTYSNVYG
jgi:hypothetical protein